MPLLKTAGSGTTGVSGIRRYLLREQRKSVEQGRERWGLHESGAARLGHEEAGRLEGYLLSNSRSLAVDVSADLTEDAWAEQMDITRYRYGHSAPVRRNAKQRTYYHFILSPALDDACSLETLRAYAVDWAQECFRSDGKLCEYAIAYHNDNSKGVPHAHIVVNATNKATGRKLHLDNDEVVHLQLAAQEVGKRHGLTPLREQMQTSIGARTAQPVYMDKAEREVLAKGALSWKMELRLKVLELAPVSRSFDEFQRRMEREGYRVEMSDKTGYLTYACPNGKRVRDCRLGSGFYIESLEVMFAAERGLDGVAGKLETEMRVLTGELKWKDEICGAIDAVSPMVLSVPELQHALETLYEIRLTVNRQGIIYQHPSGPKVRDTALGSRYTPEGLLHNAVVAEAEPYPSTAEVRDATAGLRQLLPPPFCRSSADASDQVAEALIVRDWAEMMRRRGAGTFSELEESLRSERQLLENCKDELVELRGEVVRWRLAASGRAGGDAAAPEGSGADPAEVHEELQERYEHLLDDFSRQVAQYTRDQTLSLELNVNTSAGTDWQKLLDDSTALDASMLLSAGIVLQKYGIESFVSLDELIVSKQSDIAALQERLEREGQEARRLQSLRADVRTCHEMQGNAPAPAAQEGGPEPLDLHIESIRCKGASKRLEAAGIGTDDYERVRRDCLAAELRYESLNRELGRLQAVLVDLKGARKACRLMEDVLLRQGFPWSQRLEKGKGLLGDLPVAEAKRKAAEKNAERAKQAARRKEVLQR